MSPGLPVDSTGQPLRRLPFFCRRPPKKEAIGKGGRGNVRDGFTEAVEKLAAAYNPGLGAGRRFPGPVRARPHRPGPAQAAGQRLPGGLHAGRVDQAAQYVLPASRETVDAARSGKARVLSFRILEVELEEGNRSALVTVSRTVMTAAIMSGRMPVKQQLRWKLREGEWYVDPADPPQTHAALVKEYYYDKLAARNSPKPGQTPPPLEVEFEQKVFNFGRVPQGTPLQPRFVFRNLASHDILVEKIHGPKWLIKDATVQRVVPAGADGEIRIDVDTSKLQWQVTQDFFVQFEPIREMVKLNIRGSVYIPQGSQALRQARQSPRPRGPGHAVGSRHLPQRDPPKGHEGLWRCLAYC